MRIFEVLLLNIHYIWILHLFQQSTCFLLDTADKVQQVLLLCGFILPSLICISDFTIAVLLQNAKLYSPVGAEFISLPWLNKAGKTT